MGTKKILVATDFSEMSRFAVEYATTHASMSGATVLVVHALDLPSSEEGMGMLHGVVDPENAKLAGQRLKEIQPSVEGVEFEHHLVRGEPSKEILDLAEKEKVELIVMGTHGRTGLARALMGSVAEKIVRNAACPVLVVKVPKEKA